MLKYSKHCEGAEDLQEALSSILGILKAVNDSMHLIAITGYDVRPHGDTEGLRTRWPLSYLGPCLMSSLIGKSILPRSLSLEVSTCGPEAGAAPGSESGACPYVEQTKTVLLGGRGLSQGALETSSSCLLLGQLWDLCFL